MTNYPATSLIAVEAMMRIGQRTVVRAHDECALSAPSEALIKSWARVSGPVE